MMMMPTTEEEEYQALSVLQSRHIDIKVLSCCTTMDLVALITHNQSLIVYRFASMQRLFIVKSNEVESPMTSIAWSPNGFFLAVGHVSGKVSIYDIEKEEIVPTQHLLEEQHPALQHQSAIQDLQWIQYNTDLPPTFVDRAELLLMQPPPFKVENGHSNFGTIEKSYVKASSMPRSLDILVSASSDGTIVLRAMGKLVVATINVKSDSIIEKVFLSSDLKLLRVKCESSLCNFDLSSVLAANGTEIHLVSHQLLVMTDIVMHLKHSVHEMSSQWKDAIKVFQMKMSLMPSVFDNYYKSNDNDDVLQHGLALQHMFSMACSGISSSALTQFFANSLNERGVSRMQKAFDSGCEALQELGHSHLLCATQQLLFRASELRGLLKSSPKSFQNVGLSRDFINALVQLSQNLILRVEEFLQDITKARGDFSLLFRWIQSCMRLASGVEGNAVTANRMKLCNDDKERLADFIKDAATYAAVHSEKDIAVSFGYKIFAWLNKESKSLFVAVNEIKELWSKILHGTSITRSCSFTKEMEFPQSKTLLSDLNYHNNSNFACFAQILETTEDRENGRFVYLTRFDKELQVAPIQIPEFLKLESLSFFNGESSSDDDEQQQHLLLLLCKDIKRSNSARIITVQVNEVEFKAVSSKSFYEMQKHDADSAFVIQPQSIKSIEDDTVILSNDTNRIIGCGERGVAFVTESSPRNKFLVLDVLSLDEEEDEDDEE